jgi:hypothetical protein
MNEETRMIGVATVTLLLLAACAVPPFVLAAREMPGWGIAWAALALVVWTRLVRPIPGFAQGAVALWGAMLIVGAGLACAVRLVATLLG